MERLTGWFPQAAVEEAVARREEITPELLRILDETTDRAEELSKDLQYMAHLYAMFLLAQFREVRAYPLVVRFASLPEDVLEPLVEDFITQNLGAVLASVCGGDVGGIQFLIENDGIDEWARGSAVDSLVTLVAVGQKRREEILDYFGQLYRGKLRRTESQVWNALVSCTSDLYPAELFDDIKQAYADDLVDPRQISLQYIERQMALGKEQTLARLSAHHRLVEDTVAEMESWDCFQEREPIPHKPSSGPLPAREWQAPPPPVVRDKPKTGRNEPCPCGSGKKYKKCCGA